MVTAADLLAEIEGFRLRPGLFDEADVRVETLELDRIQVPRITNELWTARQRQGHSLHELSYRACFKSELPNFFIRRLTEPGDVVFDPFMGRGTTLLEAALLGRVPTGNDANPLAPLLIAPRLDPPALDDLPPRLAEIFATDPDPDPDPAVADLTVFFHPDTLAELCQLRRWFLEREREGRRDRIDAWLRMVATNRLTGHSAGFFSGRTMPPNQAVGIEAQRKINQRLGVQPPRRDVSAILLRKSRSLMRGLGEDERRRVRSVADSARISIGDARRLDGVADSSVHCTITSPPFLDVVDYAKDNWLRCWFNGLDADRIAAQVTTARRLEDWCRFVDGVFQELWRITHAGGWVVFEVGEVRNGVLRLEESVLPIACAAGFSPVGVVVHAQEFTKTSNCWGVTNNRKGTNTNRLVLLRKAPLTKDRGCGE